MSKTYADYKFRKCLVEIVRQRNDVSATKTYAGKDEDGNDLLNVTYYEPDGSIQKVTRRAKMNFNGQRVSLDAKIDAFRTVIARLVRGILGGKEDEEIERRITQLNHPQEKIFNKLVKEEVMPDLAREEISLIISEELIVTAGKDIDKVIEKIVSFEKASENQYLMSAIGSLSAITHEAEAGEN